MEDNAKKAKQLRDLRVKRDNGVLESNERTTLERLEQEEQDGVFSAEEGLDSEGSSPAFNQAQQAQNEAEETEDNEEETPEGTPSEPNVAAEEPKPQA